MKSEMAEEFKRPQIFPDIIYPWTLVKSPKELGKVDVQLDEEDVKGPTITSPKWQWAIDYITSRPLYSKKVWEEPSDTIKTQVSKFIPWFFGSRNFVLCFSTSPTHMRKLYSYILATWALTTQTRAEVADMTELISSTFERDSDRFEAIWKAELLILPYADSFQVGLKNVRGTLGNMLIRRRSANLPTITDVLLTKSGASKEAQAKLAMSLKDLYGNLAYDIFSGENAKWVNVSVPKELHVIGKKGGTSE